MNVNIANLIRIIINNYQEIIQKLNANNINYKA